MTTATMDAWEAADVTELPGGIELVSSHLRSTNLERDVKEPHLNSPYVGIRALDVLDRVASAIADLRRTRAWSFTGPYGSGKSTLANLLDALLGHDQARQLEAQTAVAATSPGLAHRLDQARTALAPKGFLGAVATAQREPLALTVSRALKTAVARRWKSRAPRSVAEALAAFAGPDVPSAEQLLDVLTALCGTGHPVLLIIDEFGKSLEYLAALGDVGDAESDVFLLQTLAEHGAGRSGLPLFIVTLQHLSFSDYAARSSFIQTKEWVKVQGRFEDITFSPNLGDSLHLLQRSLDHTAVPGAGWRLIQQQAQAAADIWTRQGLNSVANISPEMFAGLYPLHPLTAVAAPILASQVGQHDRSLVGFLASDEPHTVRRTIDEISVDEPTRASTVRLPQLYDYFFTSGRATILASSNASRWLEVDNRLNEAHGLPPKDRDILKAIGVLNLIDADGMLRATPAMIQFALHDPINASDTERFNALQERLRHLVDTGFLTHRSYSDEYRIWQGTTVDIDARVRERAVHIKPSDVVGYFSQHLGTVLPSEVVAGAHSQRTGQLRYFRAAVSHQAEKLDGPDVVRDAADGMIIFHLGPLENRPVVNSPLPVLVGTTSDPVALLESGVTLVALKDLLEDDTIDHVATREINERIAQISQDIGAQLDAAFNPRSPQSTWHLWEKGTDTHSVEQPHIIEARSYAALVSRACDHVYPHTPEIRNEMVGRHELTSIGARARREVLTALLTKANRPLLGYDNKRYSAERALYHGAVEYLGLHRQALEAASDSVTGSIATHGVSRPDPRRHTSIMPAWQALEDALNNAVQRTPLMELYEQLMAPPYGVKAGLVPILVVTALILRAGDVALFEEGNYCPKLTPAIVERILRESGPDRFAVKAVPINEGQRRLVVEGLALSLGVDVPRSPSIRNPKLLAVTRALLERIMVLEPYAVQTQRISTEAMKVRSVLGVATDPDQLIFETLPQALGLQPILAASSPDAQSAQLYVTRLNSALDEISTATAALRREVVKTIGQTFGIAGGLQQVRAGLAERLRGFVGASLELELQGFVTRVLNENLPDEDWLDPIIIRLTNKALGDWTDSDAQNFALQVKQMARRLDRVGHLYDIQKSLPLETEPSEPGEVETHLLTLTTRLGTEERTLIHMPKRSRKAAEALVVSVMRQAEDQLGPDGARILLAALAERVAAADPDHAPQGKE